MNEPKFKRGYTVLIQSRTGDHPNQWENTNVGGYGIIESIKWGDVSSGYPSSEYNSGHLYSLWLLFNDGRREDRSCCWFEEKYLELYCSNEKRGLKILKEKYI